MTTTTVEATVATMMSMILKMKAKIALGRENASVKMIPIQCSIQMAPPIRAKKVMISLNNQSVVETVVQTLKLLSQTNCATIMHSLGAHPGLALLPTVTTLRLAILRHLRIAMVTLSTRKV